MESSIVSEYILRVNTSLSAQAGTQSTTVMVKKYIPFGFAILYFSDIVQIYLFFSKLRHETRSQSARDRVARERGNQLFFVCICPASTNVSSPLRYQSRNKPLIVA